ncbi:hypothetical protein QAD02_019278 [Eretmocerus hayati]|uniref:Uncharacterized protein n=1 Tax=Eretmocerus hayati TaxID=131215 RepID=A0ACC2PKY9_9HYME|nr:hypothetical protein QAD02_019278 [Eretmocerus hayati]
MAASSASSVNGREEGLPPGQKRIFIVDGMASDQQLDICRVCLGAGLVLRSLFIIDKAQLPPSDKVMSLASVKMAPGDGLPSHICSDCDEKLESAYEFKLRVEEADSFLRERSDPINIKEEHTFSVAGMPIHRRYKDGTGNSLSSHDIQLMKSSEMNVSLQSTSTDNIHKVNVALASDVCSERQKSQDRRIEDGCKGGTNHVETTTQKDYQSGCNVPQAATSLVDHQQTGQDSSNIFDQQSRTAENAEIARAPGIVQNLSLENQHFHEIIINQEGDLDQSEDGVHHVEEQRFAILEHDYVAEFQLCNDIGEKESSSTVYLKSVHENTAMESDCEKATSSSELRQKSSGGHKDEQCLLTSESTTDKRKASKEQPALNMDERNHFGDLGLSFKSKQSICDKKSVSNELSKNHMLSLEKNEEIPASTEKPLNYGHEVSNRSITGAVSLLASEASTDDGQTNICHECGKKYTCLKTYNNHMKQHEHEKETKKGSMSFEDSAHDGDNSLDSAGFDFNPPDSFVTGDNVKQEVEEAMDKTGLSRSKIYVVGPGHDTINPGDDQQSGQFLEVAFSEHDICNSIEVSDLPDLTPKVETVSDANFALVRVKKGLKVLNPSELAMSVSHGESLCAEEVHIQQLETNEQLQDFSCNECGETFEGELSLRDHLAATNHATVIIDQDCDQIKRVKREAAKVAEKMMDSIRTDITSDEGDDDELYEMMCPKDEKFAVDDEECESSGKSRKRKASSKKQPRQAKPIHCLLCNEKCPSRRALAEHLDTHVKVESEQGKSGDAEYQEFIEYEGDVDYDDDDDDDFAGGIGWPMENHECPICRKGYSTKKSLMRHQLLHEEPHFECDICTAKFYRKDKLKAHYDKCAEKNPDQVRKCNICGDSFESNEMLKEHRTKHVAEGILTEDDLTDTEDKSSEKPPRKRRTDITGLECTDCNKRYTSRKGLLRHLQVHEGKKYLCDMCPKKFYRKEQLKVHVAKHNIVKPYKCPRCPKRFIKEETMNSHAARHDRPPRKPKESDPPKRYLCEVCSKSFTQSTTLVAHLRAHKGIKPYVCSVCSRPFTTNAYLKMHMRTHTQERPYICQYCSRAFARADTLSNHLTSHTGEAKYHCKFCPKHFRRLKSLKEHVFIHTGQRPYACPTCDRRFNNNGSRYAHSKRCKQNLTQSQMLAQSSSADQEVLEDQMHETDEQMHDTSVDQQEMQDQLTEEQEIIQTTMNQGHIMKPHTFKTITISRPDGSLAQHHVMTHQEILMPLILPLHVTLTDANGELILPEESKIFTT